MRIGLNAVIFGLALLAIGCGGDQDDHQRLIATGTLLTEDGTPIAEAPIHRYELKFSLPGENGEVAIQRSFNDNGSGDAIVTDPNGHFQISSLDLALSYDWERDEYECRDVCVAYETICHEVTEEICLDVCTEEQCWDDCWDDCTVDCFDEVVCDGNGECWTETVCEETCTEVCDVVCETVDFACNCYWDTYEVCADECVATAEECGWVTHTYTSLVGLDEIATTHADIWLPNDDGTQRMITATPVEAFQQNTCNDEGECRLVNLWMQRDRFIDAPVAP